MEVELNLKRFHKTYDDLEYMSQTILDLIEDYKQLQYAAVTKEQWAEQEVRDRKWRERGYCMKIVLMC